MCKDDVLEKEAEKWVENNLHGTEEDYIKAFKDGVKFGYAKANEWHEMDYSDKESYKNIPSHVELLTEYNCGLFVAHCVNHWTGSHWCEHSYGIIAWKEIV